MILEDKTVDANCNGNDAYCLVWTSRAVIGDSAALSAIASWSVKR